MGTTAKKPEDMTWADIKAMFAEAARLSQENEKKLDKLEEVIANSSREFDRKMDNMVKERELADKKRELADKKRAEEREKEAKARKESLDKLEKAVERTTTAVFGVKEELGGISKSNNMMSEGYLYESLNATKTIGGIHFDVVADGMKGALKRKDGSKLEGQYDVVMINDNAVCIVEVKYRLRPEDVREIVNKHVNTFKELFPRYEGYKFYLAVGGMAIEDEAINTAKGLGVAVIRTKGGALEILDKNMKVY